jgi:hypothetical protein
MEIINEKLQEFSLDKQSVYCSMSKHKLSPIHSSPLLVDQIHNK